MTTTRRIHSTDDYILVAVSDPVLHPEATHVAAATGYAVVDTDDPRELSRLYSRARAILIDVDNAEHISGLDRRSGVYFLAADPGPIDWRAALNSHAEGGYVLPAQATELLAALGHSSAPRPPSHTSGDREQDGSGTLIAVMGASGGAGTSTLAASIARVAAAQSQRVTLIDAAEHSGGLDLLLGLEDSPGARWPELRLGEGVVEAEDLRSALPATRDGIAVLSTARSTIADPFRLHRESIEPVLDSLRGFSGVTIIDLPPGGQIADGVVIDACDLAIMLIPAEVRPAAAAAQMSADLRRSRTQIAAIVRHRGWSGLSNEDVEKLTRCEVIAELGSISRLARTTELAGLPDSLPRPLAVAAKAVLVEAGI